MTRLFIRSKTPFGGFTPKSIFVHRADAGLLGEDVPLGGRLRSGGLGTCARFDARVSATCECHERDDSEHQIRLHEITVAVMEVDGNSMVMAEPRS